ncbi:hypothetical protein DPMN_165100 [Dreissena polymorpha]|uniref:Uncharacterized protein n=1 Tax=Dreissena polymorpha TaxID=45954 RepID=A0A9D4ISY0_DREPO|nr:hypothetical protein DPMN_165100 [Dreissena polymorpha]
MARQRPTRAPQVEIDRNVIRIVQYQLEVNRCRNEEIIGKGNFGWVWPIWAGCPRIGRIVIREVQYQLEVNRCRNEEVIVNGNFGWVWPMWVGRLRVGNGAMHIEIDRIAISDGCGICGRGVPGLVIGPCIVEIERIVIREAQYQFEVNRCRNEEFQGSSAYSVGGDSGQDGQTDRRTDGRTAKITTISPRFSKSVGITRAPRSETNAQPPSHKQGLDTANALITKAINLRDDI